jgi:colanic acid biosynthesis glycosyl transferase WcaI
MRIVLLSRYFPPEIGTAANLFHDLARELSKNGHDVTVVTGIPWYNLKEIPERYAGRSRMSETMDGFRVERFTVKLPGPHKLKLAIGHLTAPLAAIWVGLRIPKADLYFAYSPPIFFGISGFFLKLFKRAPFVLGVQDLHPQCYIDQGVLKNPIAIKILEGIERFCYQKASAVTVHSEGNRDHIVLQKGTDSEKVAVLANWVDTDEIVPMSRKNEFSDEHELNDKFIVGYAGTLGMSQGLIHVVEAAALLRDRTDIEFFIVGDGIEKQAMVDRCTELGLENMRFLPMQPKSVYPTVIAACDVGLVTLNAKVKTPVVPSKILSLMAASRPVLASMPLDGDAPKLIEASGCGVCIGPDSPVELSAAIRKMADDVAGAREFGRQGRDFVVREMSLQKAVRDLQDLFAGIVGGAKPVTLRPDETEMRAPNSSIPAPRFKSAQQGEDDARPGVES